MRTQHHAIFLFCFALLSGCGDAPIPAEYGAPLVRGNLYDVDAAQEHMLVLERDYYSKPNRLHLVSIGSGERTLLFEGHFQGASFLNGGPQAVIHAFRDEGGLDTYFYRPGMSRAALVPGSKYLLVSPNADLLLTVDDAAPPRVSYARTAECDEVECPLHTIVQQGGSDAPLAWHVDRAGKVALVISGADAYVLTAADGAIAHVSTAASRGSVSEDGSLVTWIEPSLSRLLAYDVVTKSTVVWSTSVRLANAGADNEALTSGSVVVSTTDSCTGFAMLCKSSGCVDTWLGVAYPLRDASGHVIGVSSYTWCNSPAVLAEYRVTDVEGASSGSVRGDFLSENASGTRFVAWDTYAGTHEIQLYARSEAGVLSLVGSHPVTGLVHPPTWLGDAVWLYDAENDQTLFWDGVQEIPVERVRGRFSKVIFRDAPRAAYVQIGDNIYRRPID